MQTGKTVVCRYRPLLAPRTAVLHVILIMGILSGGSVAQAGSAYFLDPVNGKDSYDGLAATYEGGVRGPWATMEYAGDHAANGSTVYCRSGNYGFVTLDRTGMGRTSAADAVTFMAQPGAQPVLNGLTIKGPGDLYWVIDGLTVTVPDDGTQRVGVFIRNAHHVTVRNCMVDGAWHTNHWEGMTWYGIRVGYNDGTPVGNILIENCEVQDCYFCVLFDYVVDAPVTVRNCTLHHMSGMGVQWTVSDGSAQLTVEDCRIYDQEVGYLSAGSNTHGAGIALWKGNAVIRRNVIRSCGNTNGLRAYPDTPPPGGFSNITIENNLIYDTRNAVPVRLHAIRDNVLVRNNTIIGSWRNDTAPGTAKATRYNACFAIYLASGSDGSGIRVENNIFAGVFDIPNENLLTEDYNIFWSWHIGNSVYIQTPRGAHSRILTWGSPPGSILPGFPADIMERSQAFFAGGTDFETYTARRPGGASHRQNLDAAYQLAETSAAVGFCKDATSYPATDLLGRARGTAPDAGCYQYIPATAPHAPALAQIGNRQVQAGVELTIDVNATDPDQDPLVYSMSDLPGASISAETGVFHWTPTAEQIGVHQVTFAVSDGQTEVSQVVAITVQRSNAPPVLNPVGDRTVSANQLLTFSLSATDPDGDTISFAANALPSGANLVGQTFTWTPADTQTGTYNVSFVASDGYVQVSQIVTITVAAADRPPVLAAIGDKAVDEGSLLSFDVSATDPDGGIVTYTATGVPAGANLTGRTFTWTPGSGQAGTYEVTFVVSAGNLNDSETIRIIVTSVAPDSTPPVVAQLSPAADAIQVPLNNLVTLHITDAGTGVDANSVTISVAGYTVYQGNQDTFTSPYGQCTRSGVRNDYRFIFQNSKLFDFDHAVTVQVHAADRAGNAMNEYVYSFVTEMRSFSNNKQVSKDTNVSNKRGPVTAYDAAGNLWAAWQAGPENARDIYVARRAAGTETFGAATRLTRDSRDQCNPDLAIAPEGSVYVVWQDNRSGNWDLYAAIGSGDKFSREVQVTNSNKNETNPSIVVDGQSPACAWVAWQDDRDGNQEIYVARSSNAFASSAVTRVTTDAAAQRQPEVTVDAQNTVYIVWTDQRDGQGDIYGAASSNGPWTNVPIVVGTAEQTDPAVVAQPGSSVLHLVWVDSTSGNRDIHYAKLDGLPANPVSGASIVDDTSGSDQIAPTIVCNETGEVFVCWQDSRHAGAAGTDSDLYFAELSEGTVKTNVFVGDDGTNANQSEPALGLDAWGQPYVVWSDDRSTAPDIYFAATTFTDPNPVDAKTVIASTGATIGTPPTMIDAVEDVSIVIPPQACQSGLRITISKVINPRVSPVACLGSYDFGPSGVNFDQPATVTIPYRVSGNGRVRPYWYDSLTGALSQQGITNIENIVVASNLNALRFQTTHFTPYYVVESDSDADPVARHSGVGGGCSLSPIGAGSPAELLVPYAIIAAIMAVLRRRDRGKLAEDAKADRNQG